MNTFSRYLSIGITLLGSYLLSSFLVSNVFLNNSPEVDRYFVDRIGGKTTRLIAYIFSPKEREIQNSLQQVEQLASNNLLQDIAPGVRAASNEHGTYVQIRVDNVEYKAYTFVINGKPVTIRVPVDQPAPSQEEAQSIVE